MRYLICYDIKEDRIRSRLVKYLEGRAFRLQYSVFTCRSTPEEMQEIKREMLRLVKKARQPLLLIVPICEACAKRVWMHGRPLEEEKPYLLV